MPILQVEILRFWEVKSLARGHMLINAEARMEARFV